MFDLWSASLTPCSSTNFPASGLKNLSSFVCLFFFLIQLTYSQKLVQFCFVFKSSNLLPKDLKGKQCLSCNWAMRQSRICLPGEMILSAEAKLYIKRTQGFTQMQFEKFPSDSYGKESTCNEGDLGSIPGLERSPGGRNGNPLQYSCLENSHGQRSLVGYRLARVAKSRTQLSGKVHNRHTQVVKRCIFSFIFTILLKNNRYHLYFYFHSEVQLWFLACSKMTLIH